MRELRIGRSSQSPGSWYGSWFATWCKISSLKFDCVNCQGLFSDILHRPFLCANLSLSPYVSNIPQRNAITRIPSLAPEAFDTSYASKPFILIKPVKEWPIYSDWKMDHLRRRYGDSFFRAESIDWPLRVYLDYMDSNTDETPLYLFDRSFAAKMDLQASDYVVPECFGEDLFTVLGVQRPDHQWLIIGPERSGSTFHKDPNATSAWNAVIRGSKYWIMFPDSRPPPGVFVSEDQSEVTSPFSIAEWLIGFHAEAREMEGCVEGVCSEGEVLHVPSGWWHLVVNLEPSIAITQNFVPKQHLGKVVDFLRDKADQVSGFRSHDNTTLWDLFARQMEVKYPGLIEEVVKRKAAQNGKRKWDAIVDAGYEEGRTKTGGFSFGFTEDDDQDASIP